MPHKNFLLFVTLLAFGCTQFDEHFPDHAELAQRHFGNDAQWYRDNIPFFECSDKQIEDVYYYRWELYKAHIRNVGPNKYIITEFIDHVPWDREPYCTINAASMHHLYEGRWLRDSKFINGYINNLYQQGGNNRRYSESIADATYGCYLVNADKDFVVSQLDSMKRAYDGWSDHWDADKNLYYIPAMPDATEFTIASIDASGGTGGFEDGEAFRPTINSYMYGNALAISRIADLKGDQVTRDEFSRRAAALRNNVQRDLWNPEMQHFVDRFKVDNQFVHYWDFIRGRELAGFAPWYFNLPEDKSEYHQSWKHLIDTTQLLGKFGYRTQEPSYEYYFKQFLYHEGKRGSQWNGPSWPYQTSQAITGMINMLNNYQQEVITNSDFLHALRLFTQQHYLPNGKINLVENYDPNLGGPIVYFYWSNHYLHSSYNNLVITGLAGIRPSEGDTLTIHPLVDESIEYFYLGDVQYHGHTVTVVYDRTGERYQSGQGLSVFVDGKKMKLKEQGAAVKVFVGTAVIPPTEVALTNQALNIGRNGYPTITASVNNTPDSVLQAIDGRIWYFPEIRNRWSTLGSKAEADWLEINFGKPFEISALKFYPFVDNKIFGIPEHIALDAWSKGAWHPIILHQAFGKYKGNTMNALTFDKVTAEKIRVTFQHRSRQIALSEIEFY